MKSLNTKIASAGILQMALFIFVFGFAQGSLNAQAPPDYTACAIEGGRCNFTGTKNVKFGANGNFVDVVATDWFECSNTAFGSDPASGVTKQCYVSKADFNPWGYTKSEQDCHDGLQRKVQIRSVAPDLPVSRGDLAWPEKALRALCKGTTDPPKTIDCWKEAIKTKGQQEALRQCASVPLPMEPSVNYGTYIKPAGPREIDFTLYDTDPADEVATPDESDPLEVEVVNSPLSQQDLALVMKWIADKTASQMAPYCYKDSYGRGVGSTLGCASGLVQDGGLCYSKCQSGYGAAGPVCYSNCPAGFRDIGALCQKPASYGRGAGYPLKFGEFSLDGAKQRCDKDNPQGCEKNGLLYYPKCKAGFYAVGCCVCSPVCPDGLTDTGTDCAKKSYGRGAGSPITTSAAGLEKNGALCYPQCKSGYSGSGPTCFQTCPASQPTECAAGCAVDKATCGVTTAIMVYSVFNAVYSIATLGTAAKANLAEIKALRGGSLPSSPFLGGPGAASGARAIALNTAQKADAGRLSKLYNSLKRGGSFVSDGATRVSSRAKLFAGEDLVENAAKAKNALTQLNKFRVVYTQQGRLVASYSDQYARNFAAFTSPEIDQEINSRFGPIGRRQIKREWARVNLSLVLGPSGIQTAQSVLSIISVIDPTGLTGVAAAFTNPVCNLNTPFPSVTVRYRD